MLDLVIAILWTAACVINVRTIVRARNGKQAPLQREGLYIAATVGFGLLAIWNYVDFFTTG